MNFFEAQAHAKTSTTRLIVMFVLAVLSLILVTNLLVMLIFGYLQLESEQVQQSFFSQGFDWQTFAFISVAVACVVLVGSVYKTASLSSGGRVVAESLNGSKIRHATGNFQEKVLLNVVEEMAIASGTPVPPVYVMRNEQGINAFAAGFSQDDAVIGITQGALDALNREELQGVIAHEFSHILHGDMRLNMRLIGVLHGILLIGLIGYHILDATRFRSRSKEANKLALLGVGLLVIGYAGTFFGNMIKASVSRQREYLADASAVQFTRDNQGIANALKKIGGATKAGYLDAGEAPSMSHAFFANAIASKLQSIFATHPPLEDRIKRIDPQFDGKFDVVSSKTPQKPKSDTETPSSRQKANQHFDKQAMAGQLTASIGLIAQQHIYNAQQCIAAMPNKIVESLHTPTGARVAIYCILLADSQQENTVNTQRHYLQSHLSADTYEEVLELQPAFANLAIQYRLPAIEIALPQLRELPKSVALEFLEHIEKLIGADNRINLFEWSVQAIIKRYFTAQWHGADTRSVRYTSISKVQQEIEVLLSTLAFALVPETEHQQIIAKAQQTFALTGFLLYQPNDQQLMQFSDAVNKLRFLSPLLKEKVIALCIYTVTLDENYSYPEQEIIRAIADSLGCPIPMQSA